MSHQVIRAAGRALHNIFAPGMPKIFCLSIAVTLLALAAFSIGMSWLLSHAMDSFATSSEELPWMLEMAINLGIGLVIFSAIWMFFPLLLPLVISFFDEKIAEKIERQEYPKLMIGVPAPFWQDLRADLGLVAKALLLNILCFPLFFIPLLGQLFYWVMNGYLVGQSFFVMAGGRHVGKAQAIVIARQHRSHVILAGMIIVGCAVIPVVNLMAPFWGVAIMVHLYQSLNPPTVIVPQASDVHI